MRSPILDAVSLIIPFAAVTVTYVLYIAAELPSNLLLKKIGPRLLLPGLCFTWGVITTLQCLVRNYSGLLGARLMLGLAEGGKSRIKPFCRTDTPMLITSKACFRVSIYTLACSIEERNSNCVLPCSIPSVR